MSAKLRCRILRQLMIIAAMFFAGLAAGPAPAQEARDAIGTVIRIQGDASGTRGGATQALGLNASVSVNESVSTGAAGRLEITFKDNTRVTLGENARLTLDRYIFNPATKRRMVRLKVVGAFRFISGKVANVARSDVKITTPVASVGVRGTDFWAGPIDDLALGVFLMEGAVQVSNAAGTRTLDQPGQGTNIGAPGKAPGLVTLWPQAKIDRAMATVAFR
jgi:hypothetical protein